LEIFSLISFPVPSQQTTMFFGIGVPHAGTCRMRQIERYAEVRQARNHEQPRGKEGGLALISEMLDGQD
jgi:hypothetical protein